MEEKRKPTLAQLKKELGREEKKSNTGIMIRNTFLLLIVVAAAAIIIAMIFMPVLQISGTSMQPTLENGDTIICLKQQTYDTGDIIGVYYGNEILVKRVIAGPSDWVDIDEDGNVYVNGVILDEPYLSSKAYGNCDITLPYQVPDNRYFVMGDSRADSIDSRMSQIGGIRGENIIGKLWLRVYPFKSFGLISRIRLGALKFW